MDHNHPARARIELTQDDLAYCQPRARTTPVTLHFTNWPGTPSRPVTVLWGDEDGNIRLPDGRKLFAMPDELSTIPRAGLEVQYAPGDPDRVFTLARMTQGFRDQAHLDAFYAYRDHVRECSAGGNPDRCGQPGPAGETTDGGWQPSETICPAGRALLQAA
jgi:hypothetical protein